MRGNGPLPLHIRNYVAILVRGGEGGKGKRERGRRERERGGKRAGKSEGWSYQYKRDFVVLNIIKLPREQAPLSLSLPPPPFLSPLLLTLPRLPADTDVLTW